ncbi:MAG: EscF/YscF/HrpA family type III secretion system needle major subunit [Enterovibrio sp.]
MAIAPTTPVGNDLPYDAESLSRLAERYETVFSDFQTQIDAAIAAVEAAPSNPAALARLQGLLGDYSTAKSLVSTLIQSYRNIDQSIIRNMGS